jgi:hypothetical protein
VNGLLAACEIDNTEPAHTKPYPPLDVDPLVVRPTVNERLAHTMNLRGIGDLPGFADDAGYSTHESASTCCPGLAANVIVIIGATPSSVQL